MRQVWPNVNHYARDLLKKSIEPSIQDSLAGYGFKFERIILGSIVSIYQQYLDLISYINIHSSNHLK